MTSAPVSRSTRVNIPCTMNPTPKPIQSQEIPFSPQLSTLYLFVTVPANQKHERPAKIPITRKATPQLDKLFSILGRSRVTVIGETRGLPGSSPLVGFRFRLTSSVIGSLQASHQTCGWLWRISVWHFRQCPITGSVVADMRVLLLTHLRLKCEAAQLCDYTDRAGPYNTTIPVLYGISLPITPLSLYPCISALFYSPRTSRLTIF